MNVSTQEYILIVTPYWYLTPVIIDFSTRCDPCVQSGPEISQLAEDFKGRVAILGINNESIFGVTKPPNMELLSTFLEEHPDEFRYTIMVDDAEGFAKDGKECKIAVVDATHPPRLKPCTLEWSSL